MSTKPTLFAWLAALGLVGCFRDWNPPAEPFSGLAAGGDTTCVIRGDHHLLCWGANDQGQLGDGSTVDRAVPGEVPGLTDVAEVALSAGTMCARLRDGQVSCWGANQQGQVGSGSGGAFEPRPRTVAGVSSANRLALSPGRSCAIAAEGLVSCWGAVDPRGHWGDGKPRMRASATEVRGLGGVIAMAGDCALLSTGTVSCMDDRRGLVEVTGLADVSELTAGDGMHCARTQDGHVSCWGSNQYCRLGRNYDELQRSSRPIAMRAVSGADSVVAPDGACVVAAGVLSCQGGAGDDEDRYGHCGGAPRPVVRGLGSVVSLAMGRTPDCALDSEGTVACWTALPRAARVADARPLALPGVFALVAGSSHVCALGHGGNLWCWGHNSHGQLGDNTTHDHPDPVLVALPR